MDTTQDTTPAAIMRRAFRPKTESCMCRPMPNISSTIASCAMASRLAGDTIHPSAPGPTITPLMRYAGITASRMRCSSSATTDAVARTINRSITYAICDETAATVTGQNMG